MKRIITFIAAFTLSLCVTAQEQIINGGFEVWENVSGNNQEPVQWNSFLTATGSLTTFASNQIVSSTDVRPGSQGTKSAKINARSTLGIIANGNLTLGRINMGSMSPTDLANYNFTQRSNSAFNHPFSSRPDSIVFWAKTSIGSREASLTATIHDDIDFKDPFDAAQVASVVGQAVQHYANTATWKRFAVPFIYTNNGAEPRYILISASTNKTAGVGSGSDVVFLDDIELIYNPVVTANNDVYTINQNTALNFLATGASIYDNDVVQGGTLNSAFDTRLVADGGSIVTSPTNGGILSIGGVISYVPMQDYYGTDMFKYRVYDENGINYSEAIVSITINFVPDPVVDDVVAVDDAAIFYPGVQALIDVLANDFVGETGFDLSALEITTAPHKGTATIENGKIRFISNQDASGSDSLTYKICDNQDPATCSSAMVRISFDFSSVQSNAFSDLVLFTKEEKLYFKVDNFEGATYVIYSVDGSLVSQGAVQSSVDFNVSPGVYIVHIQAADGQTSRRVLKQ